MKTSQAITAVILAFAVGYAAGYFSLIVRFPLHELRFGPKAALANATPPPMVHPITAEVNKARKLRAEGKLSEAQRLLTDQLLLYPQVPETRDARELLGEINTELFFSNDSLYAKTEYVVQRGDSLARIAQKLKSSPEMIMRANSLASTVIRPGDRLVVPDGEFTLTIDLPKQRVVVHHGEGFFKQYPIQSVDLPKSSQPQTTTKVTGATFWKDGKRVAPNSAGLGDATPWVNLEHPGYILYGVSEENGVEPDAIEVHEKEQRDAASATPATAENSDVPPHGIALLKDDLAELQLLIRRGTPVTIIRERK